MTRALTTAAALLTFASLAVGCKARQETGSDVQGLAAKKGGKNIALLMSGNNKNASEEQGSKDAVAELKKGLTGIKDTSPFTIREYHSLKKADLLKYTTEAARDVGADGTLLWYVGSHGWSDGFSTMEGRVKPSELIDALRAGRENAEAPMARLVMLFDYCGSGGLAGVIDADAQQQAQIPTADNGLADLQFVSADSLVNASSESNQSFAGVVAGVAEGLSGFNGLALAGTGTRLYDQALFFAAAASNQTTAGSTFTESIGHVLTSNSSPWSMTIGQFLDAVAARIKQTNTNEYPTDDAQPIRKPQKAFFRTLPDNTILADKIFHAGE